MLATGTVIGVVVLAVLIWFFLRTRSQDLLAEMIEKRRSSSRVVSRADYIEGMQKLPVAISLTDANIYYENADLQASFELPRIDEIEYDDELATGRSIPTGSHALRLRSHGATFEFVMPDAEIAKWQTAMPGRRTGSQTKAAV